MQATLTSSVTFTGVGLHSGAPVRMVVHPAPADHGISFVRTDVTDRENIIPATYDRVGTKPLCSELSNDVGVTISTVEHIMAALAGCGVHNARIDVNGPEVPILDGASSEFVRAVVKRGLRKTDAPLYAFQILRPVIVEHEGAIAMLTPAEGLEIDFHIEFSDAAIGRQHKTLDMRNGTFVRELSDSRTFCRKADIDGMHAKGLALGGTYDNAVVVDGEDVLSPGGLRHDDEAVRHKMLDALGDLYLAGAPILGRYTGVKAGHAMTNRLLRKLFETPGAVARVECNAEQLASLPGVGVRRADLALVA